MPGMQKTREFLAASGLPATDGARLGSSELRFPDGTIYRVEIPSVEGPEAFEAVLDEAEQREVRVDRISQGSGIMLQTDNEIRQMVDIGAENAVEVCLFVGPRGAWDVGSQARSTSGAVAQAVLRGTEQLVFGLEDVVRGCELGLRSVLVADIGQLWVLGMMKESGHLPSDLTLKTSIGLPAANPATAHVLESLGATSINLPVDLSIHQISAIREAVKVPLDIYIEGADDFSAPVRYYEIPEIVRCAAPVYLKFTVRNAPALYPAGGHLRDQVIATARERVRRAAIGLALLNRYNARASNDSDPSSMLNL